MKKNVIATIFFAVLLFAVSVTCWLKPETAFSESERRDLAKKPLLNAETLWSGEFMKSFEEYTTDQFPGRDFMRMTKALFSEYALGRIENNGLYTVGEHISKIEYPENPDMVNISIEKMDTIYNKFLKDTDTKVYLSIVPDKNYFLAPKKGCITIDYNGFIDKFKTGLSYMEYIDIIPYLSEEDYYYTDSHWKQEKIGDVAWILGDRMGTDVTAEYKANTLDIPFMGVYAGQSALPTKGDTIKYLTSDTLDNCFVKYLNDKGFVVTGDLYNMEKASGKDPYELFLSGTTPLVTIENPSAQTDKELVLFRDSFGSSLAPLLAEGYKKITVVDIRYIQQIDFLKNLIDFESQDVLFIYSTTLLNSGIGI
ncbi:MAG: DHHW family protein [Clostridia bacterium]|nr:DHHW family protein [Clostridia bacterium]